MLIMEPPADRSSKGAASEAAILKSARRGSCKVWCLLLTWCSTLKLSKLYKPTYFIFYFYFLELHLQHIEFPHRGVKLELHPLGGPTPQPQRHGIRATSATYAADCGIAGSLTHWGRPWIESASSWILVWFLTAEPQRELQPTYFRRCPAWWDSCVFANDSLWSSTEKKIDIVSIIS